MVDSIQEIPGVATWKEEIFHLVRMGNVICWATADASNAEELAIGKALPAVRSVTRLKPQIIV